MVCLIISGCKAIQFGRAGVAPAILAAQAPGTATGAGATLVSPANAAAPSTQQAERTTRYFPPVIDPDQGGLQKAAKIAKVPEASGSSLPSRPSVNGLVESITEKTSTTIGQHQSASGIVKAAAELEGLSKPQWAGILCIVGGVLALLWSAGHDRGYPLVFWKIIAVGVALLFVTNPWWLLLLLLPAGLYAAQKFGLLRLPLP